jgi:hypothetical protein
MANETENEARAPAAYIEHPVTPDEKKALRRKYPEHRFIDVRFAPPKDEMGEDDVVIMKDKPKAPAKGKQADKAE